MFKQEQTVNVYIDGHRYTSAAPQQRGADGATVVFGVMMFTGIVATAPLWAPVWLVWRFREELLTVGYYLTVWPVDYTLRLIREELEHYRLVQMQKETHRRQMELEERRRPVIIVVNNRQEALEAVKQHRLEVVQPDSIQVIDAHQYQRKAAELHVR